MLLSQQGNTVPETKRRNYEVKFPSTITWEMLYQPPTKLCTIFSVFNKTTQNVNLHLLHILCLKLWSKCCLKAFSTLPNMYLWWRILKLLLFSFMLKNRMWTKRSNFGRYPLNLANSDRWRCILRVCSVLNEDCGFCALSLILELHYEGTGGHKKQLLYVHIDMRVLTCKIQSFNQYLPLKLGPV